MGPNSAIKVIIIILYKLSRTGSSAISGCGINVHRSPKNCTTRVSAHALCKKPPFL